MTSFTKINNINLPLDTNKKGDDSELFYSNLNLLRTLINVITEENCT